MITEDLAVAHYQDNFTHPTYIMTMLMGVWVVRTVHELVRQWVQSGLLPPYLV